MITLGDIDQSEHCPKVFHECEVIYDNDWTTYEESGWVVVFRFFDEFMIWEGGYCVMSEDNTIYFDPEAINEDQLEQLKEDWKEIEGFQE